MLFVTLAGLVAVVVVAGWLAYLHIPHKAPLLHVTPPAHVLTATPGALETVQFTVNNKGGGELLVKPIPSFSEDDPFEIENDTCRENALTKDKPCLVQIRFKPKDVGTYHAELQVDSDGGNFTAKLTGHCTPIIKPSVSDEGDITNLPAVTIKPHHIVKDLRQTTISGSDRWRQAAVLAGLFFALALLFGWYLIKARQPPDDQAPDWDETKPRHFPLETVGGEPSPRLDDETLAHLADSISYFRCERAGRRPDIDASVLATVENGGIPQLVFQRGKKLRHLVILEDGLATEALALNPIAGELRAGMNRRGIEIVSGRFFGDPAVFHTDSGRTLYFDDLEAARQTFLLLIFSDGSSRNIVHTLEKLARWPHVAWFDLRAPENREASAALPAKYGIPLYSATAAGLLQAFARFLSEMAPQTGAAQDTAVWKGAPPRGDMPMDAYLETLLGDALPWAQACSMVQPVGAGLADGLRRAFYAHLPPERIERLALLPGTTRDAVGFCFQAAVLAELRRGFARRHPSEPSQAAVRTGALETVSGLPTQEQVLGFILAELKKSWVQEVREKPVLQDSPAQLAWEKQYQRAHLELDPDAALPRLAQLAKTPLGNAVMADLEKTVLPEGDPAGIPLRKAPTQTDNLQRLARIAVKSGIRVLDAYPWKLWQRGLVAFLVIGFLGMTGWSVWAYIQSSGLRPRIEVTGGPDMRVKAAVQSWKNSAWQTILPKTGLPFEVEITPGIRYRLALYGADAPPLQTLEPEKAEANLTVQLATEPVEIDQVFGDLVATDAQGQVLNNHLITVRNALFSQTVPANKTLHLAPGQWLVKVEMDTGPPYDANTPAIIGGSQWQSVTIAAGEKIYKEFTPDAYFRDRLKNGGFGPQMVRISAGTFTMGSPKEEAGRGNDEGPQHPVTLGAFAMSRHEVTFDQYDAFCEATGSEKPDDGGWGRGSRPVINVSWEDARDYAAWLSEQSSANYRLPTEAEWEYAARAGSEAAYTFGSDVKQL
ncbi:MAG: formylglycine-generating enzyme family protein, partial [Desulfobacteraceae bacterium]